MPGGVFDGQDTADARRVARLPKRLVQEMQKYLRRLVSNQKPYHPTYPACLWYDVQTKRCKHWELRPTICRNFTIGGTHCLNYRRKLITITVEGKP
jgi:Fe-S-cluster containining protein